MKPRLLVVTVAVAAVVATAAYAAGDHSYVIKGNVVGGFPTSTGGAAQAFSIFGGPVSSTQDRYACAARWPDGLILTFKRHLPFAAWPKACKVLTSAVVTGRLWRTDKGLRVGSPESAIKTKYPKAVRLRSGSVSRWNLVPGLNPALQAWARSGRIGSFHLVRH